MSAAISLKAGFDSNWFRVQARSVKDANQARRLLALAAVADGKSRTESAQIGGMDRQTLRDWVHRFNSHGLDGLQNRQGGGVSPALDVKRLKQLFALIDMGPIASVHGVSRWRQADLRQYCFEEWGVSISSSHMSRILRRNGYRNLMPRPQSIGQKSEVLEDFKKTSPPELQRLPKN